MSHPSRRTLAPALVLALTLLALPAGGAAAAPPPPPLVPLPSPLSAQPGALDFGTVPVSYGEQSSSPWIQNSGPDPIQVGAATVDGDSAFRVANDGCDGQLLATGQGCGVSVGFQPADGVSYSGTLHVPVAGFADLDVPLSGVGGVQRVTLDPSALDFGALSVGDSAVRSFSLTSTGTLPFTAFVTIPSGGDVGAFHVESDGCVLQQLVTGTPCQVAVRFAPTAAGAFASRLLMIGGDGDPAMVPLQGTGVAAPAPPAVAPPVAVTPPPVAGVAFDAAPGLPARYAHGRVDLGLAHCVAAARCTVVVRARVYAVAAAGTVTSSRAGAVSSARTDVVLWNLRARGLRTRLGLPAGLHGRPALLVATLRTQAAGRRTGLRTLVVELVPRAAAR